MLNEMLAKEPPFSGMGAAEIRSKVMGGGRPDIALSAPRVLQDIVTKCWAKEPTERPSFEKILDLLKDAASKV
jgi:mitogen-activated protein kinase kinase kinase 7